LSEESLNREYEKREEDHKDPSFQDWCGGVAAADEGDQGQGEYLDAEHQHEHADAESNGRSRRPGCAIRIQESVLSNLLRTLKVGME